MGIGVGHGVVHTAGHGLRSAGTLSPGLVTVMWCVLLQEQAGAQRGQPAGYRVADARAAADPGDQGGPAAQREREIVEHAVPGLARELVDRLVGLVETLRRLNLKKPPSVSETIDLARTLHLLGATDLDVTDSSLALNVLLKYRDDVQIAEAALTPRQWKKRP